MSTLWPYSTRTLITTSQNTQTECWIVELCLLKQITLKTAYINVVGRIFFLFPLCLGSASVLSKMERPFILRPTPFAQYIFNGSIYVYNADSTISRARVIQYFIWVQLLALCTYRNIDIEWELNRIEIIEITQIVRLNSI